MDKRLVVFLSVTFGLSWVTWAIAGILTGAATQGLYASAAMGAVVAVSMFFPLAGALAANAMTPEGQRIDLCVKPHVRGNGRLYALAWFLPAVFTVVGGVLFFLVFPQLLDENATQLRTALEAAGVPAEQLGLVIAGQLAASLTFGPLVNSIPAFGEEAGWRGMLFPLLSTHMSERRAVIASGIIWGIWHAPITAMGHNYGLGYPGYPVTGILTMVVACTSIGCLLVWLRLKSGSVWPCAVAHGAINAIVNVATPLCKAGPTLAGPSPMGLVAGIPTALLAILCWRKLSAEDPMRTH